MLMVFQDTYFIYFFFSLKDYKRGIFYSKYIKPTLFINEDPYL